MKWNETIATKKQENKAFHAESPKHCWGNFIGLHTFSSFIAVKVSASEETFPSSLRRISFSSIFAKRRRF